MSPSARAQIAMGGSFVTCNFAANPTAAADFVKGMCDDAAAKLRAGGGGREMRAAIAFAIAALEAGSVYAELTYGAGETVVPQPNLDARVAEFRGAA
jgi:hypothetical protein